MTTAPNSNTKVRMLVCLLFLLLSLLTAAISEAIDDAPRSATVTKQILVLDTYQSGFLIMESIDRGILSVLREGGYSIRNVFMEYLDFARAPSSEHRTNMVNLLRHKLADKHIGVVITIGPLATDFMTREGKTLFPDAAIITLLSPNYQTLSSVFNTVMNFPWHVDPAGTLRVALDLFPKTKRIFVVTGGDDKMLPFLDQAREAFSPFKDELEIKYSNEMTYDEMLRRVATLPDDAIVIYSPYLSDSTGRAFVPTEVVVKVCQASKVPVFSTLEQYMGSGIVGGSLLRTEDVGRRVGKITLDYVNGIYKPVDPVTSFDTPAHMQFDWHLLTSFNADISRLPKESILVNRPLTLWGQYKSAVVTAMVVILIMSTSSIVLIILNRRLKQAKDDTIESERRFRTLMENAPEAIVVYDVDLKRIVDANIKAVQLFGCTLDKLLQSDLDRFYPPNLPDSRLVADSMDHAILCAMSGEEVLLERLVRSDDGRDLICELRVVQLPYNNKQILRCSFIDITSRKQIEEEKYKLEAQLHQSQKMESVGRLAGGVAHDFNNLLGVIIGYAELALRKIKPDQPHYTAFNEISKAADRSAALTRQLLAFARKQVIAPKVIDLNETVSGMIQMLRRLIGEDIYLTWQPVPDLWPVKIDPSQIDQILANLCVNARDAIENVGNICIETCNITVDANYGLSNTAVVPGEYVRLVVSDDGSGMDKETVTYIFEPFYTTKEQGKGTGLGLAMVHGVVKQNNGFINVYSEPGKGSSFSVYLPRHSSGVGELCNKEYIPELSSRGSELVLLVEDEPANLKMAALMLECNGYTVLAAGTTGEAIRLFREHTDKINLLITDVVMPDMNGRDLANELRTISPQLKCLFMSGYTANVIAHHGVLDDDVNFVQKPFSLLDFATKVRNVLDSE